VTDEQRSGRPKDRAVAAVGICEMASYIYRVFALQKNWSSWTVEFLRFEIEYAREYALPSQPGVCDGFLAMLASSQIATPLPLSVFMRADAVYSQMNECQTPKSEVFVALKQS
jgi:hypothetical protein